MPHHRSLQRLGVQITILAVLTLVAGSAAAVELTGKLLLGAYRPLPEKSEAVRPLYYWELENGFKEVAKDRVDTRREIAVVLLGKSKTEEEPSVEIAFSGGGLLPSTIVVRQGTTLRIRNKSEIAHELFTVGGGFPVEATSPRAIRAIHLAKPGNWPLRDRLVTHLRGHLHVLPDLAAVGKVKANGEFSFGEVPAGKYTLKAFHGRNELVSKAVEVADEKEMTLDPITLTAPSAPKKGGK